MPVPYRQAPDARRPAKAAVHGGRTRDSGRSAAQAMMNLPEAWRFSRGQGQRVAVIDTASAVIDTTDEFDPSVDALTSPDALVDTVSPQFADPVLDDATMAGTDLDVVWGAAPDDAQSADHTPGFDLFD